MHALDVQTSAQAFRQHVTVTFISNTYVSIPVMANDTMKPIHLQIRDAICQTVDKREEGVEGCRMDFFVKVKTIMKAIFMQQEGFYVNTFTLNPSLAATFRACQHANIPRSREHNLTRKHSKLRRAQSVLVNDVKLCTDIHVPQWMNLADSDLPCSATIRSKF